MNYYLNAIGLILDIIGVIGLYFTKIKGSWCISSPTFNHSNFGMGIANQEQAAIKKLHSDICKIIDDINLESKKLDKKSVKWLILILIGFTFQIGSSIYLIMNR